MPSGLDTVVPVENVEILASEDGRPTRIALKGAVKPGQHVRLRGQDRRGRSGGDGTTEGRCDRHRQGAGDRGRAGAGIGPDP
ncbi:hypothetical protein G6F45_014248 [Rhizopus arrhizus]|nr:hypothetical protein G6F45_014248 [Rhizopus arrhizus]